ncbi:glycosyltransferase involved in cell wall biosynthesis [Modicisalibacter xianhensis]|uniref:Glycosyltransferase involved in cell wall biosynthesis n=1 Tax=Modicisalibacter xianhensis TaxID=442341 RepID=A0A4R8G119_9GAMM|nr:glycosyltransferase family 4 protein [Halomonas xianhensis]TDX28762.1 glycosyltransferase involved in cell wall biosynthesis [Halomonas xianhensis]
MVTSPTPLRVRHVNLAKGFRGGERQTVLLIRALAAHGVSQSLVCRHDSPLPAALAGVDVAIVAADHQLAGHFRGGHADLVHAHEAKAVHWAYLHHRLRGVPYILTRRVPQPVKDKPFNRLTYRSAASTVAISRVIEQHLDALGWCPVTRIPSALSHLPSDPQQVEALRQRFAGRRVVGHIGALVDRHKGQRLLIDAARRLRESHPELLFVCLGQGEDDVALRQESADLENLVWEGFRSNVGDYLEAMDLFAFPSRNEGLGSTLLDVMDHDVPIVATDVDGIPDIVVHEQSGLLVPANDAVALTQGIVALLDDPERCRRLVAGARQRLAAFTPAVMAERYLALYRRLLAHR